MDDSKEKRFEKFEQRLDSLREEAREKGTVSGNGVRAAGGPMPPPRTPETMLGKGYYGLPFIKPPVWEWMIPLYFFIGGLTGMSALIASAALLKGQFEIARVAMWSAGIGGILAPILLTADLGRPLRFLYMLRVFKYQSPMSVGSWIVTMFGAAAIPGLGFAEWHWHNLQYGNVIPAVHILALLFIAASGLVGIFLSTYTGALIAVTAVPAWNVHRAVLPFHFGMAGLGSAAAVLWLAGFHIAPLSAIILGVSSAETLVMLWMELRKHGAADRALHEGKSGWTLRAGEFLEGPLALALACAGILIGASIALLLGACVTRFGWISAGRKSANDPESVLASQRGVHPPAETRLPYSLKPSIASTGSIRK